MEQQHSPRKHFIMDMGYIEQQGQQQQRILGKSPRQIHDRSQSFNINTEG